MVQRETFPPLASETSRGSLEKATSAEAIALLSALTLITPETLKAVFGSFSITDDRSRTGTGTELVYTCPASMQFIGMVQVKSAASGTFNNYELLDLGAGTPVQTLSPAIGSVTERLTVFLRATDELQVNFILGAGTADFKLRGIQIPA